ncbi:uncharacterized protein ACNS7B_023509 [Menidia menidia]|uniref:(Atlantic silverside) hypothetical protein n=1 Tax=Menidia menidia TaxID=238744 RepID=A0A8S4AZT6_9TELE|nr:unnamed protein product [Menidia menidia]
MPLLCISLLASLLLPLSLSCETKRSQREVGDHFQTIVQTHLDNTRENISISVGNNCTAKKYPLPNCRSDRPDFSSTLLKLACKMHNLQIPHTEALVETIQLSIGCPCPSKATKDSPLSPRKRKRATRQMRKLCRAQAILSSMTGCYQMLNVQLNTSNA